jgi:GNAT superfamily N-acetyltransferase
MNIRHVRAADADPHEYLRGANESFGEWGDEATYRWAFRDDAELLFVDEGGVTIAASAILYRTLIDGGRAAIIAGSWTSPAARGRGVFARILETTSAIAHEQNALLLGFGRSENASARRFDAAGAGMHRSFYCRSVTAHERESIGNVEPDFASLMRRNGTSFRYTLDEWQTQFLFRPHAQIDCVGVEGEWCAIVERTHDFDRVHAITDATKLPSLAARAHAADRRLFCYVTRIADAELLATQGFEWTEGFVSTLPSSPITDWDFQNGDRM